MRKSLQERVLTREFSYQVRKIMRKAMRFVFGEKFLRANDEQRKNAKKIDF